MTPLNSEEVALSQPRISEFLSDNANKDSIRPTAPSSQMSKKHQTWALKLRTFLCWRSPSQKLRVQQKWHSQLWNRVPLQLPLWSLRIQAIPRILLARLRWSEEKTTKKKKREKKRVMKGLAGMSLADLDQESSDHSSGQTKRARESSDSLSSTTNLPQKRGQHESLMICKEAKPRKRRLAQAPQLVMLGLWRPAIKS